MYALPPSLREVPRRGGGSGVGSVGHSLSHAYGVPAPSEREPRVPPRQHHRTIPSGTQWSFDSYCSVHALPAGAARINPNLLLFLLLQILQEKPNGVNHHQMQREIQVEQPPQLYLAPLAVVQCQQGDGGQAPPLGTTQRQAQNH